MLLTDIIFPIFPIRKYTAIYNEHNVLSIDTHVKHWIIDNKNLVGDTLAKRRLKIPIKERYPLNLVIFTIAQLLLYKSSTRLYIDVNGKLFKYKKTRVTKLAYYKVIKYSKIQDNSSVLLWLKNIPYPILCSAMYFDNFIYETVYAGLLDYNDCLLLYELSNTEKETTWRKI